MIRAELELLTIQDLRSKANASRLMPWHNLQAADRDTLIQGLLDGKMTAPANGNGHSQDLAAVIASAIGNYLPVPAMDEKGIREIVRGEIATHTRNITVTVPGAAPVNLGKQHQSFGRLLHLAAQRAKVMLVGPTGSGKTAAAEAVAKALNLSFLPFPVGPMTGQHEFLGYKDAQGKYQSTEFRKRFEDGGIVLIDEIDGGNAGVLLILNAALANGVMAFPDGVVRRHPDCIILAAANTYGRGADRQYVGRNQLDAAFLDRFFVLSWDYDETLETEISGNPQWSAKIQEIRKIVNILKLRVIVSPRASIEGAKLLSSGMNEEEILEGLVWKGLDESTRSKILENLTAPKTAVTPEDGEGEKVEEKGASENGNCSCGGNLVLKRNRKTGSRFYGCSNYPKCRHTKRVN